MRATLVMQKMSQTGDDSILTNRAETCGAAALNQRRSNVITDHGRSMDYKQETHNGTCGVINTRRCAVSEQRTHARTLTRRGGGGGGGCGGILSGTCCWEQRYRV